MKTSRNACAAAVVVLAFGPFVSTAHAAGCSSVVSSVAAYLNDNSNNRAAAWIVSNRASRLGGPFTFASAAEATFASLRVVVAGSGLVNVGSVPHQFAPDFRTTSAQSVTGLLIDSAGNVTIRRRNGTIVESFPTDCVDGLMFGKVPLAGPVLSSPTPLYLISFQFYYESPGPR
jgi:hypothetical protein